MNLRRRLVVLSLLPLTLGGCVERTLTVKSDPPEALLYMNGMEVGRTPVTRDFTWYGVYDVELRKDGYETVKAPGPVIAPLWQWVPFDLIAEILPFRLRDRQLLTFSMRPTSSAQVDPQQLLDRAESMAPELESSTHTRSKTTRPAKRSK